ncbi:hypothetical protein O59_004205 [Cellvibrio sp. BR]|jgi:hypothetical protein|nr:hypothetical protein O59_004205 [Cellvibrio sp. BR]
MVIGLFKKQPANYHAKKCEAIEVSMNTNAISAPKRSGQISQIYSPHFISNRLGL